MTETTTVQPSAPAVLELLKNPSLIVSRREELVKLATGRATQVAAAARVRVETAKKGAAAQAQKVRKASDAWVATALGRVLESRSTVRARSAAYGQLQRAARVLQDLAKRIEPKAEAAAPAAQNDPGKTAA